MTTDDLLQLAWGEELPRREEVVGLLRQSALSCSWQMGQRVRDALYGWRKYLVSALVANSAYPDRVPAGEVADLCYLVMQLVTTRCESCTLIALQRGEDDSCGFVVWVDVDRRRVLGCVRKAGSQYPSTALTPT